MTRRPHHACRPPGRRRGLTLVELMFVVAVLFAIVAIAAPSFGEMITRQRVRSINAEMITDVQYARTEAIQRSKLIRMRFGTNTSNTCYSVFVTATSGECYCAKSTPPRCTGAALELKTVIVPRSSTVTLTATSAASNFIDFDPARGMAVQDDFQVEVASSRSGHVVTRVSPLGQIAQCSPDGSISGLKTPC